MYPGAARILQCSRGGTGSNSFFSILFCLCIFHKASAALHLEGHLFHQLFYLHSKSYAHEKCATEFWWRPFESTLDRICHMNLMHANLCRWPHYCGEMDCLIKHIIRHICRLGDQIEAVFFEQIPFVKFVSVHAAVLDLGHREEEAGSLVLQVKAGEQVGLFLKMRQFFHKIYFISHHLLSLCLSHIPSAFLSPLNTLLYI